eukprot:g11307.t1
MATMTSRRVRSSLTDLAIVLLLAVANQADGFYFATGRVGGRESAASTSRQVSASKWSPRPRPTSASARPSPGNVLIASTMESRDKEAAPGDENKTEAAKKGGESTGDGDGDGDEGVVSSESKTVQLSKRVQAEGEMAGSRAQRMAELNSELKRSFAKKEEVENMIASEIARLGIKLRQERDIEIARAADLEELLKEFDDTIAEKQAEIEKEQDLLAQMQALRGQVDESSIRAPIEEAMAKKADVTSIEVMLLEDLVECKEKLEKELKSTSSRGETMNGVVAALPSEGDTERMRAYNWQDVEDLQEVLLSSAESMEASDAQVGSLRTRLLDSVAQKREVLGEAPSTELVRSDGGGAKRMTTARAFQASADLSEEELLDAVAQSSKSAAAGVVKSVAAGADSLGSYIRSPEGQDVAASTVLVIGALAGAANSVSNAIKAAKKEFDENALPGEELTSFDKIIKSLQSSLKAVQESPAVKAQLAEAGDLLTKQVPDASARVGQGTVEALKGAASNKEVGNPVKEALGSLEQFIVSLAALGTKYFSASRASRFQLPGSSTGSGDSGDGDVDEQKRANAKLPSASPPPKSMEELTAEKSAAAAFAAKGTTAAGATDARKEEPEDAVKEEKAASAPAGVKPTPEVATPVAAAAVADKVATPAVPKAVAASTPKAAKPAAPDQKTPAPPAVSQVPKPVSEDSKPAVPTAAAASTPKVAQPSAPASEVAPSSPVGAKEEAKATATATVAAESKSQ